ncbi:hypothetical protein PY32053_02802 [Paracoccus yeei]|uniref:Uncharacterized protein n=1 Tax=Paracoccus yeei TaxID=147645 RepID=A0A386UP64_9RHOB|nr:hypothetical protein [Paracoccus yeei]AYF02391.1 hypothetical protein PY32053_02802 [Paracoccus yeei]
MTTTPEPTPDEMKLKVAQDHALALVKLAAALGVLDGSEESWNAEVMGASLATLLGMIAHLYRMMDMPEPDYYETPRFS